MPKHSEITASLNMAAIAAIHRRHPHYDKTESVTASVTHRFVSFAKLTLKLTKNGQFWALAKLTLVYEGQF